MVAFLVHIDRLVVHANELIPLDEGDKEEEKQVNYESKAEDDLAPNPIA